MGKLVDTVRSLAEPSPRSADARSGTWNMSREAGAWYLRVISTSPAVWG